MLMFTYMLLISLAPGFWSDILIFIYFFNWVRKKKGGKEEERKKINKLAMKGCSYYY